MGWAAEGQEISSAGAAEARSRGHRVQVAELSDCDYQPGSIDAATMIEVIEHIRDPGPTLTALLRALRPGGWLLVTTGDIGSLGARVRGCQWSYIRPPGHVSYFSRRSLIQLLTSAGFRLVHNMPTYNLAFPSIPGFGPSRFWLMKSAALQLRRMTLMEQCILAQA